MAGAECRDGLGRSALAVVAMQGDAPAAEALLEWGYDPNGPDGNHLSPLSYAAWKGALRGPQGHLICECVRDDITLSYLIPLLS